MVGPGYVVTNAHVVAGAADAGSGSPRPAAGSSTRCRCFFDPELDVALLHVDRLRGVALRWASKDPERGALGATLGYPGGRAADDPPSGRRRAAIRPPDATSTAPIMSAARSSSSAPRSSRGDSGGPLVLADGTVGGVVFAEAQADPNVGYALAATEVCGRDPDRDRPDPRPPTRASASADR